MRLRCRAAIAIAVSASMLGGCSWFFAKGPGSTPIYRHDRCSESNTPAGVDTVIASLYAGVAAAWVYEESVCDPDTTLFCDRDRIGPLEAMAPFIIVFGASAITGWVESTGCARTHAREVAYKLKYPAGVPREGEGSMCRKIPGVAHGGTCDAGLHCSEGVCVSNL
jgi:hypothetical protein